MPTTAFIETIPAAGAGAGETQAGPVVPLEPTETMDPGNASVVRPGALPDPTSNPVVTRDDVLSQEETTTSTRPGEFSFYTVYNFISLFLAAITTRLTYVLSSLARWLPSSCSHIRRVFDH